LSPGQDPSRAIRRKTPKGRHQIWSDGEVVRLVKGAWRAGYCGLACIIAVAWDTSFAPVDKGWSAAGRRSLYQGRACRRFRRCAQTGVWHGGEASAHGYAPLRRGGGQCRQWLGRRNCGEALQRTYMPVNLAAVREADEARRRGRGLLAQERNRHILELRRAHAAKALERVARVTGLEPATSGVTGRHSNRLSYTRARRHLPLKEQRRCAVNTFSAHECQAPTGSARVANSGVANPGERSVFPLAKPCSSA
jgi:hypothetical protein